jgi:hypothetical protein
MNRVEVRDLRHRACRSRGGEAGGSLSREVPVRVGAAPTTTGRVSTARWRGSGKRDGEEYARNQRAYVLRKVNRLESGGSGPGVVRTCPILVGRGTSGLACGCRSGRPWRSAAGSRGDATGTELGSSSIERTSVNVGTVSFLARNRVSGVAVRAGSTVDRPVRDGAEPP